MFERLHIRVKHRDTYCEEIKCRESKKKKWEKEKETGPDKMENQ